MKLKWIFKQFDELTPIEFYAVIRLRNEVFVVEQNCVYQDADDKDQHAMHLMGWHNKKLVAYTRIIPPGICFEEASIGRVVTSAASRNSGAGRALMELSIKKAFGHYHCNSIKIGAQVYLAGFYESLGFVTCSEEYLEDGIPHIKMILKK